MHLTRIGKKLFCLLLCFLLIFSTVSCASNQQTVKREVKDLPINLNEPKINFVDLFKEYNSTKPKSTYSISNGEKLICYSVSEHNLIVERIIDGNLNRDNAKLLVEKYNLLGEQLRNSNDIYKIEQQKRFAIEEQLDITQKQLEKEHKWREVEDTILKWALVIIATGACYAAATK